jgi:hypothetical protein
MKDLPQPIILLAKKKAVEATKAWDDTVNGILKASRAVHVVHEKIGGNKTGTFSLGRKKSLVDRGKQPHNLR